ncbi:glycosyltransferase family 2 protein [Patescibacteria group bacterium]|nr:glycosyltransferase family 2 protein [Patescibacteria group bacterium]
MISIIIPIYNQADKIGKCLDSILNQTYKNFEIIIVNDGSTDNIEKVLKNYKSKFSAQGGPASGWQIFSQKNKGAPAARNRGYGEASGEYLFFCDADAVLKPEALKTMLNALKQHQEASYAFSSFLWGRKLFKLGPFDAEKLKKAPYIHTMSLIRREHFPASGWDESIKKLQDWDLWLTMLEQRRSGVWIDKVLFKVQTGGTISSWLPSFAYKFMPFLPNVKKYKKAMEIIKKKHNL